MAVKDPFVQPGVGLQGCWWPKRKRHGVSAVHRQIREVLFDRVGGKFVKTNIPHQIDPRNNAHHSVSPQGERPTVVPSIQLSSVGSLETAFPV